MQISDFMFEVLLSPTKKLESDLKLNFKSKSNEFAIKFRETIETGFPDLQIKQAKSITVYKTKEYKITISNIGGYIENLLDKDTQEISESSLSKLEAVIAPLFQNLNKDLMLHINFNLTFKGNFEKLIKNITDFSKIKKSIKDKLFEHRSGVILSFKFSEIPIELYAFPNELSSTIIYCGSYSEENIPEKINLGFIEKINFIKNKVMELEKI